MFEEISYDDWNEMKSESIGSWELSMLTSFVEDTNSVSGYKKYEIDKRLHRFYDEETGESYLYTSLILTERNRHMATGLDTKCVVCEIEQNEDKWIILYFRADKILKFGTVEDVISYIKNTLIKESIKMKKYIQFINESKKDKPNFKKIEIDGYILYQGKDAKANDYVTMDLANDEDYWFHAKGVPGSHVVIKVKDKVPTNEIIKYAAEIAAKNCKSKEDKIEIVYCKKKFVKKEPGMNAGQVKVDYNNAYTIFVSEN